MKYLIMRKDDELALADFETDGTLKKYIIDKKNSDLLPLHQQISDKFLIKWWENRSVPIKQGNIENMLRKKGLVGAGEYLLQNMGLSLTDYYWIKPVESNLKWKDVNLFANDFKDNLMEGELVDVKKSSTLSFTPNSSLQGQLEKNWIVNDKSERILIKGNKTSLSSESMNEVVATELHRLQGYDNYTKYQLLKIKNKNYDYGCFSKAFTNEDVELVPAYDIVTSKKQKKYVSTYEHFINICGEYGIDKDLLRSDMEYQILTDFIISNRDRHLANISILRDGKTMKFLRMAPIYDSGKSMFVHREVPRSDKAMLDLRINSFTSQEIKMLEYVKNPNLVDLNKVPTEEYIKNMYLKDSKIDASRVDLIVEGYKRKIDLLEKFQHGISLNTIKYNIKSC